jgi:hypothetical protein
VHDIATLPFGTSPSDRWREEAECQPRDRPALPLGFSTHHAGPIAPLAGVIAERRTVMRKQSVVSLMLTAALLTGCAAHQPPAPANGRVPAADDEAGSVAANILYVPGRGLLCGASGLMAGVAMIVTFGQAYDSASELMHGGCSGPWVLGPRDIRQAVP